MITYRFSLILFFLQFVTFSSCNTENHDIVSFNANHSYVRMIGRFDFSDKPKVWAPGAYLEFWFSGTSCEIEVEDQAVYNYHNYLEIKVDNLPVKRVKLQDVDNIVSILKQGKNEVHHVYISKCTEAGIGSVAFGKIYCDKLIRPRKQRKLLFEFIGDSMTCGNGADCQSTADVKGDWYEQHAAFQSYGPTISRALNADWMLSSVSGFGLTRSCCGNNETIPQVYDFADLGGQEYKYNWKKHKPNVVFICLGQNDGLQKVEKYCFDYVGFVKRIKKGNPKAHIVCLDSPMAKMKLKKHLDTCIIQAVKTLEKQYGNSIHAYFFKKRYYHGRLKHPNISEHQQIAKEIELFLKSSKILNN